MDLHDFMTPFAWAEERAGTACDVAKPFVVCDSCEALETLFLFRGKHLCGTCAARVMGQAILEGDGS